MSGSNSKLASELGQEKVQPTMEESGVKQYAQTCQTDEEGTDASGEEGTDGSNRDLLKIDVSRVD